MGRCGARWALAACGGGDGTLGEGVLPPPVATTAEGAYAGTLSGATSNNSFQLLVLDGGEYGVPYGVTSAGVFYLAGFIQRNGTSAGASPCSVPGQLGHGVAVVSPISGSSLNQLLVGLVSNDRSAGSAYVGSR